VGEAPRAKKTGVELSAPNVRLVQSDATPLDAPFAPGAEFAFTEQPGHPRGHVSLLCSLALVGAISPPEAAPSIEPAPVVESSPTVEPPPAPAPVETPAPEPAPFVGAPGGYWTVGEQHERSREPLDGEDDLTIGSVIFSLGFVRAGAGVLTIVMSNDSDLCPITEPRGCSGLRSYGWVGVAEGGLMVGTGLAYMIIGAARRERHRRWKSGEPLADVGPWLIPRAVGGFSQSRALAGAGLRLQLQF
jgi:hypothetical protein